jgi:hypothetical protein
MSASKKSCGCCDDPDYIWRQVDCGPARDAASYYIRAAESGREPPGRWWGPGAKALGLEPGQVVDRKLYDLLFGERKAPDGAPLGSPPGAGRPPTSMPACWRPNRMLPASGRTSCA